MEMELMRHIGITLTNRIALFCIGLSKSLIMWLHQFLYIPAELMIHIGTKLTNRIAHILLATMRRGALIVLEGCDKCGKSTQSRLLVKNLLEQNVRAERMQFPERSTDIGKILGGYLKKEVEVDAHAIHLMFSANRWELRNKMLQQLHDGVTLVVDRYAYSGVAYTVAKGNISLNWSKQADTGLPKPDLVFFLDLDSQVAKHRGEYGDERFDNPEFQSRAKEVYLQLQDKSWKFVNADQGVDDLQSNLLDFVLKATMEVDNPIEPLWV